MSTEKPATISDALLFHSCMARIKVTPGVGQRKGPQVEALAPSALPSPDDLQKRREEVGRLEVVGRSPGSLSIWWLVQMVAEVGPSGTAGLEWVGRIRPTMGGMVPTKSSLRGDLWRGPRGTGQGQWLSMISASIKSALSSSSVNAPSHISSAKLPKIVGGMTCTSRCMQSWVLLDRPPGRWEPMHHPCEMHYHYAQRYSAGPSYLSRVSSLLNLHLYYSTCFGFLLVVGCVWITGTREGG